MSQIVLQKTAFPTKRFNANRNGGCSPGEDTGQGALPDEGGGRKWEQMKPDR